MSRTSKGGHVFPDVSAYFGKKSPGGELIGNADDLCMYLLHSAHVSVVTGKSLLAKVTAYEFHLLTAPRILSKVLGRSKTSFC